VTVSRWLPGLLLGLLLPTAAAADPPAPERRSGYALMSRETQAMQDDDAANPGMLWVLDGAALWRRAEGPKGTSCAACHGDAETGMRGIAAHYPAYDAARSRPIDLEQRINTCRTRYQQAAPLPYESHDLLALTAFAAYQSRGRPIAVADDRWTRPFIETGRRIFESRQGQLNLSCAQCHDAHWGRRLAGATIPQAHPTGYPLYRLEWQTLGSIRRRLRECLTGMRAELYPDDAPELVDLELFLAWRARGLPIETPAVRP
jgi:sulfur-oxidizing protein SoxA